MFPHGGKSKIIPRAVRAPFSKTLHFLGEHSPFRGKGKAIFKGKISLRGSPCEGKFAQFSLGSGKEKAHNHKQIFLVTARAGGGLPTGWGGGSPDRCQGSNVYVLCAEPKTHKNFRSGTRPGGSVTGVTKKLFMCQMFMCLFRPLLEGKFCLPQKMFMVDTLISATDPRSS